MRLHPFEKDFPRVDVKHIQKKKIFTVKSNRDGRKITCLGGMIWITQEGDGIDRILTSGDIYQSRIPGDIIIEGLDHSQVRITPLEKVEVITDCHSRINTEPACA